MIGQLGSNSPERTLNLGLRGKPAAKHHTEAGNHYGAGRHEQAAREAYLAHGHYLHASNHAAEAARLHARHFGQK